MLLPILQFSVELVSQLVCGKNISGWWRGWDYSLKFFWHFD
jgi:hypothetical protein